METAFSRSLKSNRLLLNAMLRMDLNDDLVTRPFRALGLDGLLLYVEGMASGNQIGESILRPLLRCPQSLTGRAALETAALAAEHLPAFFAFFLAIDHLRGKNRV